jgi:hypothetical protein
MSNNSAAVLGAFIDTLYLNVFPTNTDFEPVARELRQELKDELTEYKLFAQERDQKVPTHFKFDGLELNMKPTGGVGFFWILENSKLTLSISRNARRAMWAQVRLSSEYLWSVRNPWGPDLGKVLSDVLLFLEGIFGPYIRLGLSALDMTVDLAHMDWGSIQDIQEHFISRAQLDSKHVERSVPADGLLDGPDAIHRRWRRLTGFSFGARKAAVSATIYDKQHEIKYNHPEKAWFFDLWRSVKDENGEPVWDGESPVWRVEMRLRREALNSLKCEGQFHGIDDPFELEALLPSLWAYLVGRPGGGEDGLPDGWLRYVVPNADDTNRSRWPVHPDWEVVQRAFLPVLPEASEYEHELEEQEECLQAVDEELEARPMVTSKTPVSRARKNKSESTVPRRPGLPAPVCLDLKPLIRERKRKVNIDRMVAQITGCLVTLEAWLPEPEKRLGPGVQPDLSMTLHEAYPLMEERLTRTCRDFADLVEQKRPLYSIETAA